MDGTSLIVSSLRTASIALPGLDQRAKVAASQTPLRAMPTPASYGLESMAGSDMTAAGHQRAKLRDSADQNAERMATGSGTAAPQQVKNDKWSKPFVDYKKNLGKSHKSEEWIGNVLGSYKLLSILGKGGMGCVYKAEHVRLGREVALKVLRPDYAMRKDAVARFFQEARAVNKIRHRNIVDITDFVELEEGVVFIIMEYLEGSPLTKLMGPKVAEPLETIRALNLLIQICDGLTAAHSVGIVHRDLKPDNIIVSFDHERQDIIKLLDFGVAKLLEKTEEDDIGLETVAGSVVGTPAYMSPEQAGGLQVDGRADIYSLGAIMYEMFTRQPMFRGKSFGEYVRLHLNETPTLPSKTKRGQGINPAIEATIMMCLEKSPNARFQSAQELRADLLSLLSSVETSGELTGHLAALGMSAEPIGAALPASPVFESSSQQNVFINPLATPTGPQGEPPYPATTPSYPPLPAPRPSQSMLSQTGPMPSEVMPIAGAALPEVPTMEPGYQSGHSQSYRSTGPLSVYDSHPSQVSPYGVSIAPQPSHSHSKRGPIFYIALVLGAAVLILLLIVSRSGSPTTPEHSAASEQPAVTPELPTPTPALIPPPLAAATADANTKPAVPNQGVGTNHTPDAGPPPQPPSRFTTTLQSQEDAVLYAAGSQESLCTSPCDFVVEFSDGKSRESRDYEFRLDGFETLAFTIDFRAPKELYSLPMVAKAVKKNDTSTPAEASKPRKPSKNKPNKGKRNPSQKPKCKAGAQDTFNPFGDDKPCR